jgi:hypothetical protein
MFEKHCQICGIEVDKTAPKRFSKLFFSKSKQQLTIKTSEIGQFTWNKDELDQH